MANTAIGLARTGHRAPVTRRAFLRGGARRRRRVAAGVRHTRGSRRSCWRAMLRFRPERLYSHRPAGPSR